MYPAKKQIACRKADTNMIDVVRVCESNKVDRSIEALVLFTLNNLGGKIAAFLVFISKTAAAISKTPPTQINTIVSASFQLVSPEFNPINKHITPEIMRPKPMKSNSFMCWLNGLRGLGFRFRKKNNKRPATPPVGLR